MVVASLTLGGIVGVALSGAFLWWEVGRYATPQVPVTVFDERKVLAAYTVGLFVGVPLAAAYLLFTISVANAALVGAALFLAGLVVGTEVAQLLAVRSAYWGSTPAAPFYAVSLRAGVGGILALAAVADYFAGVVSPTATGIAAALLEAAALVALEVAGAFLSLRARGSSAPLGGPIPGGLFGTVAFFLLGIGPTAGPLGTFLAPLVVLAGAALAFRGRRHLLADVPPPSGAAPPLVSGRPAAYGRTAPLPSQEPNAPKRS